MTQTDEVLLQHELPFLNESKIADLELAMRYGRWLLPEGSPKEMAILVSEVTQVRDRLRRDLEILRAEPPEAELPYENPDQERLATPIEGEPFEAFYLNEYTNEAVVWIPAGIHEIKYFDGEKELRYKLGFPHLYVRVRRGRHISCGIHASPTRLTSYSQKVWSFPMLNRTGNGSVCFSYRGNRPRKLKLLARKVALAYLGTPFNTGAGIPSGRHPIDDIIVAAVNETSGVSFLEAWEKFTAEHGMKGILGAKWDRENQHTFENLIHKLDRDSYENVLWQGYARSKRRKEI